MNVPRLRLPAGPPVRLGAGRATPARARAELTRVPLSEAVLPPMDLSAKPPPGRYVEVSTPSGALRLHVRETPGPGRDAPLALYVHGLAGSATNWTDLAGLLDSRLRGIAVDLPGFGRTEPPPDFDFGRQAHAEVVIGLLEALDRPVHLFGNSFGGAVGIEVAVQRPDLVATLTLISPAMPDLRPDPRRVSDPRIALAWLPLIGSRMRRAMAATTPRERAERLMRLCFAHPELIPPHRVDEAAEEFREYAQLPWIGPALGRTTRGLLRSWVSAQSQSLWGLLGRVTAPTLVLWGDSDRLVHVGKAPRTANLLARGRLLVLPHTGHVAQIERPRMVARAALGMLEAVEAGTW